MQLTIYQVDAFSEKVFGGNPAAVVPLENWLSDDILQKMALENNLSETAYFIPNGDQFDLRWFTPGCEVNLCGHATLATAHVLFKHLDYSKEVITFLTKSGELIVKRYENGYLMDFPSDHLEQVDVIDEVEKAIGIKPKETYKGRDDFMAILDNQQQIEELNPDFFTLGKLLPSRGLIVTAPGNEVDFVSRGFFPNSGINEDPVTGSAHTTMTPYWAKKLGKNILSAIQLSQRQGKLTCIYKENRVELIGQAVTFLKGTVEF